MGYRIPRAALPTAGGAAPAPPFALPVAHFAASLGWLVVAAVLLPSVAPALARGAVFDAPVLAAVHVLTLGVVATAIFGTLQQFIPVGLGVPLRSVRLGWIGLILLQMGVMLLVVGLWWWHGAAQAIGWVCVLGAVGAVSRNVLRAHRVAVHGRLVGRYVLVAHSALGSGMFIAAARIGETLGWWHVDRMALLAAHALLGTVGFGTLSAIGVGSRMLPTFLQAPGDDTALLQRVLTMTSLALTTFVIGALFTNGIVMRIGAALLIASGLLVLTLAWRWFARRARALDAGLWHLVSAFSALAVAVVIGAWLTVGAAYAFERWAALMGALIVGWLVTLLVGVLARILPRMTVAWLSARSVGATPIAPPHTLLPPSGQWWSLVLMTIGWSALLAALLARHALGAQVAALVWSVGALSVIATYARLYRLLARAASHLPRA